MNYRLNSTGAIAKRKIFETFISPGFYIALSIGLLLGYFVIGGFVDSIDSSGLNYSLNSIYELIARSLSGAFGETFVIKLFAEGPYLFALFVSFIPFLFYLAISSVFKFGFEKKVGALELITYGPADGTSYFLASFVKDMVFTLIYLMVLLVFFFVSALINNLVLGPMFFYTTVMMIFLSFAFYGYGVVSSVLTDTASSAIALFLGIALFFLIIQMGSFTIVSGYVRNLSTVLAWIIKWISPVFYLDLGMSSIGYGNVPMYLLSMLLLLVLTGGLLLISHLILKVRGVRV